MEDPIINLPEDVEAIAALVREIEDYRVQEKLTTASLLKQFSGLGTDRTWSRLKKGDLEELDATKWLGQLRAVANQVRLELAAPMVREELYSEVSAAVQLESAYMDARKETGNARFILMLGDTGMGKSSAMELLIQTFGDRVLRIEATEVWGDSPMAFLGTILNALGMDNPPYNTTARLNRAVEKLSERRVFLIVDEGHHLGPKCLNTIKTLINRTPGEFGVLAMKTLWRRLEKEAYEEARQLTGNRLAALIDLTLTSADIEKILERRVVWDSSVDVKALAALIQPRAVSRGNLALAREVAKACNEMRGDEPATNKIFTEALAFKGGSK